MHKSTAEPAPAAGPADKEPRPAVTVEDLFALRPDYQFELGEITAQVDGIRRVDLDQIFADCHVSGSRFLGWYRGKDSKKLTVNPVLKAAIEAALRRVKKASVLDVAKPWSFLTSIVTEFLRPQKASTGGPTARQIKENKIRDKAKSLIELDRTYRQMVEAADKLRALAADHPDLFDPSADPPRLRPV